jgi:hypothetical protein
MKSPQTHDFQTLAASTARQVKGLRSALENDMRGRIESQIGRQQIEFSYRKLPANPKTIGVFLWRIRADF